MPTSPTTPDRPAESILGPITPIRCTEPGCHWACHGVPDKYADSRARIVREHLAAEHTPTPEPADRPDDQLRAAADRRNPSTAALTSSRHVVEHALIDYGYSPETARLLVDRLIAEGGNN
ncbi:hypothetical protein ACIPJG_33965 [Streptomyces halstedii]|uniref:hypothetical protein n=1 Tax=Streptomyces halstedii TaxID=1944 RepID=UPI00381C33FA